MNKDLRDRMKAAAPLLMEPASTEVVDLLNYIDTLEAQLKVATEAAMLGLSFAPKGPVPPGLDPTFYHTLNYQSEAELQNKIDAAGEALAKIRGEK